jgi:hypothetical protein
MKGGFTNIFPHTDEILKCLNEMFRKLRLPSRSMKLRRPESIKTFLETLVYDSIVRILSQRNMKIPIFIILSHVIENIWDNLIGSFEYEDPQVNFIGKSRTSEIIRIVTRKGWCQSA